MTEDHTAAQWANAFAQRVRPSPGKVGNLAIASRGQESSASRGRSVVTLLIQLVLMHERAGLARRDADFRVRRE